MKWNLEVPINSTGYGLSGAKIAEGLILRDKVAHLSVIGPPEKEYVSGPIAAFITRRIKDKVDVDLPALKLWHQHDLLSMPTRKTRVGWTVFEVALNPYEASMMNSCDLVIVCSEWAEALCRNAGVASTAVVPLGVDTEVFKPVPVKRDSPYVFFTVGKWEVRKGHPELVTKFAEVFAGKDDVELWMAVDNPFLPPQEMKQIKDEVSQLHPNIRFMPRTPSPKSVARLMQQAHCGVFPTRAEGFGLPMLEAMACGKPVIGSGWTGHLAYADEWNTRLLKHTGQSVASDGRFFHGQGTWYNPDLDDLAQAMLDMYEHRPNTNIAGVKTAERFSWNRVVDQLVEVLEKVE